MHFIKASSSVNLWIVNLLVVGGKVHRGYENLIVCQTLSFRSLETFIQLSLVLQLPRRGQGLLPLSATHTDHRLHGCGISSPLQFRSKYSMDFTGNISELLLTTISSFPSSGTQHCMNHLLTYFKKESGTLKRWRSSTVAKGDPSKERECWWHFLGWVCKGFFPTFFRKWKYISSLKPLNHRTSKQDVLGRGCFSHTKEWEKKATEVL